MKDKSVVPGLEEFQSWPAERVAEIVRAHGLKVSVFPINGTRRWFKLEHPEALTGDSWEPYMRITWARQIEIYKLFFDHGVDTLLTPVFGPDLLERGEEYRGLIEPGLLWLSQNPDLLDFYDAYDVRVRVYGDAQRYFAGTSYAHLLTTFQDLAQRTAAHRSHRLFFGVCAHDATETVAAIGVDYYAEHGHLPNKEQIIEAYYGEYVPDVDFFIGFDRPAAFDMPLVATGNEDLYFTVSPSPYLDRGTLRSILYDHLFARRVNDEDYTTLDADSWQTLKEFYEINRRHVLGLGRRDGSGKYWYPLPQVELLPGMKNS
ncbi:MAG: diterpene synthase [Anaerolineae bacterium]